MRVRKGAGTSVRGRRETYGFPSYLSDRHEIKEGLEPMEKRTDQTLATPIMAFWKSSSDLTPSVAYSMAYMMVREGEKKLASCPDPIPPPIRTIRERHGTWAAVPDLRLVSSAG